MKTAKILSLLPLLFASLTTAVPMGKRDIEWVTVTDYETVTIDVTTTIYVNPTPVPKGHDAPEDSRPTNNPAQFYVPNPPPPPGMSLPVFPLLLSPQLLTWR